MPITSNSHQHEIRSFLLPSWLDVWVFIILSLITLVIINGQRFWQSLTSNTLVNGANPDGLLVLHESAKYSRYVGNIVVIIFWMLVASLVYMAVWLSQNSLTEIKTETGSQQISGDLVKRNYLNSLVMHYVFFFALTIFTFSSLYLFWAFLLPNINTSFYGATLTVSLSNTVSVISGMAAVILLAFIFYVFKIVIQIYVRFWRLYIRAQ